MPRFRRWKLNISSTFRRLARNETASLASSSSRLSHSRAASWFEALKRYVQETEVQCLNLCNMKLTAADVASVLEYLANSQVTELNLSSNEFEASVLKLLTRTKIKKLNLSSCRLSTHEIMNLMSILNETEIADLDISNNHNLSFSEDKGNLFISYLVKSQLTSLNISGCGIETDDEKALLFFRALRDTSLIHLNLYRAFAARCEVTTNTRLSLFLELKHTSITHLKLPHVGFGWIDSKKLGDSLRNSQLVEVDLSCCFISDQNVDDLFQSLIGSKITILNLSSNCFRGDNSLGVFLRDTQITSLDLSNNFSIGSKRMFSFPDFLKGSILESLNVAACRLSDDFGVPLMRSLRLSKLKHLNVCKNRFKLSTMRAFEEVVQDSSVTNFSFSPFDCDDDSADEKLILVGDLSARSKIQHLEVHGFHEAVSNKPHVVADFLAKLKKSPVAALSITHLHLDKSGAEIISPVLPNMPFTHLNLTCNDIGHGVLSLAANLKFTSITHLNLARNGINDAGAKALAECLEETKIIDLDLSINKISCDGAAALALFLKDAVLFKLKLNYNEIKNSGLKTLAERVKCKFITSLDVRGNPGDVSLVEVAILSNRTVVRQLVDSFKRIGPETIDKVLQVENHVSTPSMESFLEEYLRFYKNVTENSFATSILAREGITSLSKDEIATFLTHTFPQKFTAFIATSIKASPLEHVNFLKKVEDMKLNRIVEFLLLNRSVYSIDTSHCILHPYVYKLLNRYKLPICNLDVEPQGIEKIIIYFRTSKDVEGADEIVSMLNTLKLS